MANPCQKQAIRALEYTFPVLDTPYRDEERSVLRQGCLFQASNDLSVPRITRSTPGLTTRVHESCIPGTDRLFLPGICRPRAPPPTFVAFTTAMSRNDQAVDRRCSPEKSSSPVRRLIQMRVVGFQPTTSRSSRTMRMSGRTLTPVLRG